MKQKIDRVEKAKELFLKGFNCCQAVFAAFADKYGISEELALRLSGAFGAGFGGLREVCGAVCSMAGLASSFFNTHDSRIISGLVPTTVITFSLVILHTKFLMD